MTGARLELVGQPSRVAAPRQVRKDEQSTVFGFDLPYGFAHGDDVRRIVMAVGQDGGAHAVTAEAAGNAFDRGGRSGPRNVDGALELGRKRRRRDR